jgi:hypothetical protein
VVKRYCDKKAIAHFRPTEPLPPPTTQEPLSVFVAYGESMGPDAFADRIVENRQRSSPRNGILKADAALQFAKVLRSFNVESLQQLKSLTNSEDLDHRLRAITGMRSGIAVQYFWCRIGELN